MPKKTHHRKTPIKYNEYNEYSEYNPQLYERSEYIFFVAEIEQMIFDYLDPFMDYQQLILVNKYYHEIFSNHPIIKELIIFYRSRNKFGGNRNICFIEINKSQFYGRSYDNIDFYKYNTPSDKRRRYFAKACIGGHLIVAKYIYFKHPAEIREGIYDKIFVRCCQNGHLEIIKFLRSSTLIDISGYGIHNISDYCLQKAFRKSCEMNHVEIAEWLLYSLGLEGTNRTSQSVGYKVSSGNNNLFCHASKNGYIDVAKLLLSVDKSIDIHTVYEYAFRNSCMNGHIDFVKFLISLDNKIDIHALNEYAFRYSCARGDIEMVKYLLSLDGKIDITVNKQEAFRWSCENGHLSIAKYLYENYGDIINIRKCNDGAFRTACIHKKTDVAMWLESICPNYRVYFRADRICYEIN